MWCKGQTDSYWVIWGVKWLNRASNGLKRDTWVNLGSQGSKCIGVCLFVWGYVKMYGGFHIFHAIFGECFFFCSPSQKKKRKTLRGHPHFLPIGKIRMGWCTTRVFLQLHRHVFNLRELSGPSIWGGLILSACKNPRM